MGEQSLGRMIRRRRESLGFSQARLGELVGRSASTIRNWERGKSTPAAAADAVALAAVLGLNESEVVVAAGFDEGDAETHQTVEQAYASLSPERPQTATSDEESDRSRLVADPELREPATAPEARVEDPLPSATEPAEEDSAPSVSELRQDDHSPSTVPDPRPVAPRVRWDPVSPLPGDHPAPGRRLTAIPSDTDVDTEGQAERDVARAAPPTVLEVTPQDEPSYLEDPDERQRYRARALATATVVVFLLIVFLWSLDRAVDALDTMWDDFMGMLEL